MEPGRIGLADVDVAGAKRNQEACLMGRTEPRYYSSTFSCLCADVIGGARGGTWGVGQLVENAVQGLVIIKEGPCDRKLQ